MAGELRMKLLVASVHNLTVLLIFFDFNSVYFSVIEIFWHYNPFKNILDEKVYCTRGNFHSPSIQLPMS